jgi:hypothetical protein
MGLGFADCFETDPGWLAEIQVADCFAEKLDFYLIEPS